MRVIYRDIVGGFIFSNDGKLLLGKNRKGGVYEGLFTVPGGGVDDGETKEAALRREMLEETGLDVSQAKITVLGQSTGEHEKTLPATAERVLVKMNFFNYRIDLSQDAEDIILITEDDWHQPHWFGLNELKNISISSPARRVLVAGGLITA